MCICEMCLIPNNHIDCFKRKMKSCLFLCLLQQAIPFSYACYDHKTIKMKRLFYHLWNDSSSAFGDLHCVETKQGGWAQCAKAGMLPQKLKSVQVLWKRLNLHKPWSNSIKFTSAVLTSMCHKYNTLFLYKHQAQTEQVFNLSTAATPRKLLRVFCIQPNRLHISKHRQWFCSKWLWSATLRNTYLQLTKMTIQWL